MAGNFSYTDLLYNDDMDVISFSDLNEDSAMADSLNMGSPVIGESEDNELDSPILDDGTIKNMIEAEPTYLPKFSTNLRNSFTFLNARKGAFLWIFWALMDWNYDPLCLWLAMDYFDKFVLVFEATEPGTFNAQILAIACLRLAARMMGMHNPPSDFWVGGESITERIIEEVELKVKTALGGDMLIATPFHYVDFYLDKINFDKVPMVPMLWRSEDVIVSTLRGVQFLEFRSSEIGAAVAIQVLTERQPIDLEKVMHSLCYVDTERVFTCLELLKDMMLRNEIINGNIDLEDHIPVPDPESPKGVIDAVESLEFISDIDMDNRAS